MELFAADGHDAGGCERVTGKSGMRPEQPHPPRCGIRVSAADTASAACLSCGGANGHAFVYGRHGFAPFRLRHRIPGDNRRLRWFTVGQSRMHAARTSRSSSAGSHVRSEADPPGHDQRLREHVQRHFRVAMPAFGLVKVTARGPDASVMRASPRQKGRKSRAIRDTSCRAGSRKGA